MKWNLNSDRPIYTQLVEILQVQIVSGVYAPGDKIPSVRELAAEASVNPNTMQKALTELERKMLLKTQRTTGRTVTEDVALIEENKNQLAKIQIEEFLKTMKELGYTREQIIQLLQEQKQS